MVMQAFMRLVFSFVVLMSLYPQGSSAQVKNPVSWAFTSKKLGAGKFEVRMTAVVEKGWHIYSQTTPEGGPIPTSVEFTKNPLVVLTGNVKEVGKMETHFEKLFDVNVKQYSNKVEFVQTASVKGNVKTNLSGTVEYMLCNDTECLPPVRKTFSVSLQ